MDLILSTGLYLALLNPSDESGKTIYPSGIKEVDKYPLNRWPSTKNPLLKIPYHFFNEKFELCPPGVYDASIQNNKIILVQGNIIKANLNAFVEDTDEYLEIPKALADSDKTYINIVVYQNGKRALAKLSIPR